MKNKILLSPLLIIATISINAQNLLDRKWKFNTGDNLKWAENSFNDSSWTNARIGEQWENWGYTNYDGYAWYRKKVFIPAELKNEATKNGGFMLNLDKIDDVDFTYFNGNLIGQTGQVPPNYSGRYLDEREYIIPNNLILWNQYNTIAVRVFDYIGGGGMCGNNIALCVRGIKDMIIIKPNFKEPNHVINFNTLINIPVEVKNSSINNIEATYKAIILNDYSDTITIDVQKITIASNKLLKVNTELKNYKPGIYKVFASIETKTTIKTTTFNFALNPEQLTYPPDTQTNFTNYWQRAKYELAAVAPQYKLIKVDSLQTATRNCFLVEMRSLGNVLIRAWLLMPKKEGIYPAVLSVQGYSTNMFPTWVLNDDNVISLGLNVRGHGNSTDNVNPRFPGYLLHQLHDNEQYIYRGAYMDCVRAIDFLYQLPQVDTTRVAVEGASQGGALTIATAALCPNRIKVAVPSVPFLSCFPEYFKVASWPTNEFAKYAIENEKIGMNGTLKTLSYIDITNLAPWVKAPIFMGIGLIDDVCPPRINFAAYNNLNCEKNYVVYPTSGHGLPSEFNDMKIKFIKEKLNVK